MCPMVTTQGVPIGSQYWVEVVGQSDKGHTVVGGGSFLETNLDIHDCLIRSLPPHKDMWFTRKL